MRQQSQNATAFRAMVVKEFRANARWMLLGFVVTAIGLLLAVAPESRSSAPSLVSMYSTFLTCTVIVGLLLGVAAMIGESRGDALGFLLHRPVARSIIFAGKLAGGLTLYLGAVGVPVAILTLWAMLRGNVPAPFDVLLLRGPVIDILIGAIFFLTAFFGAMREARWFATRWVAIGAAGVMLAVIAVVPDFGTALALSVLALAVCAVAAWGTFLAAGRYEQQPIVTRLATALIVVVGLGAVSSVVGGTTIGWISDWVRPPTEQPSRRPNASLELTRAGPVRVVRENNSIITVTDMNGREMDVVTFNRLDDSIQSYSVRLDQRPRVRNSAAYHSDGDAFWTMSSTNYGSPVLWYFVRRTGLVVGYDLRTKLQVAWVSPSGFAMPDARPRDRFDGPLQTSNDVLVLNVSDRSRGAFLVFPSAVFTVNASARVVEKVFSPRAGESVISAVDAGGGDLLISTTEAAYLRRMDGSQTIIRHPERDLTSMTLYRIATPEADAMYVRYAGRLPAGSADPRLWAYTKLALDGTVKDQYAIPVPPIRPLVTARRGSEAFGVLVPALLYATQIPLTGTDDYGRPLQHQKWFFPLLTVFSLVSCTINILMAHRHAFALVRQLQWGVLGLLLGPLGVGLMFALMEWPNLEKCPACGRKRVVIREKCEHCAGTFTPPQKDGTEILEFSHSSAS